MSEVLIFNEVVERNFTAVQDLLNQSLREKARQSGWPEKVANSLYIDFINGTGSIQYPAEYAKEVEDLEYGTPDSAPTPFIRLFKEENDIYNEFFENMMMELVFESGAVL